MHGGGEHGTDWVTAGLAPWLQGQVVTGSLLSGVLVAGWQPLGASYNILTFDIRGDWGKAGQAAVETVRGLAGGDSQRVAVIGASAGADGAMAACEAEGCVGVLALSPTGSVFGERFAEVEARLEAQGKRVWCAATEGDGGCPEAGGQTYRTWVYPGGAHGLGMLGVAGVEAVMREFLRSVLAGQP